VTLILAIDNGYNDGAEYSGPITNTMPNAPRQAVLLAGGVAFGSTDRMESHDRATSTRCVETPGARDRDGYVRVQVAKRRWYAHRLAYTKAFGPIPDGQSVLHTCDNPPCVNPGHLFLGSQADNMADMSQKGRRTRGSTHGMAKLTEADVAQIRALASSGVTLPAIASRFGVHFGTISKVVIRRTWRHVR
jgi:hypothetical protein